MLGCGVGNIAAISKLAVKVYTAYKDAPNDYRHISEEVISLQTILNTAVQHFESITLSDNDRQLGQGVLKGCQSVLGVIEVFLLRPVRPVRPDAPDANHFFC